MKFRTPYTGQVRMHTNAGSREANDYEIQIDRITGHKKLVFIGTHDIYDEIQSYADECKVENILARSASGDINALNQRQGMYADISSSPKTLMEAQNSILKLSNFFDKLPAETREKFDNSKEKFVNMYGTEDWIENMGFKTETAERAEEQTFSPEQKNVEVLTPEA